VALIGILLSFIELRPVPYRNADEKVDIHLPVWLDSEVTRLLKDDGVEAIQPKDVWDASKFNFTHAVKRGNILTVSGQNGINLRGEIEGKNDFATQARLSFENMGKILSEAGMSFDDVLMIRSYFTDISNIQKFSEIQMEFFKGKFPPAQTAIEVTKLALPGLLIEVDALAVGKS
jgi:enamine deaminase RidA (YjgF/YER057c/UK114 family)